MGPLPEGSPLTRLRNAGEVSAAEGDLDDLPEPVQLPAGMQAPVGGSGSAAAQ